MLPSPPEASRNKQEYFPDSARTPSLPASFPWRWYDFLQAAQIVLSEYANSPRAWFAAAQPGTQAVFLPINTCLIDSSFPHVPKKKPKNKQLLRSPRFVFCCPWSQRLQREQEPVSCHEPKHVTICCLLSPPSFPPVPICFIADRERITAAMRAVCTKAEVIQALA